ncbi:MAG TPA: glycosyltransferase family 2 protein [Balneolaceae bacterium]|nr:glycosyltransferase family 2 protein [Balneolaceae bacterium]
MRQNIENTDTKKEPFVSVLTPVYNGEKFLRECIESVLNQDYDNWEYVLVNNQSTDRSLQIMQEYAEKDSRIRIHNNEEFLPQLENLNHAFRQISPESKYCKVVHADDWIYPACISKMVEVAEEYSSAGIVGSYRLVGNKVSLDGLPYPSNFVPGKEIARKHLLQSFSIFGSPTSILLRSDLIRKREKFYEESLYGTDTAACLDVLTESDFGFVHQVLTFTRLHEDSITNTKAKDTYAFIHARLYMQLEYGPFFLTEEEHKKTLSKKINLYYVALAKNLLKKRSAKEFRRQLQILGKLGLRFEKKRFFRNILREIVVDMFKIAGFKIEKYSDKSRKYDFSLY